MSTPQDAGAPGQDRVLADDLALPVNVVPNANWGQPEGWDWHVTSTSQPNAATFHISHSDVTRVFADVLTPADSPPEAYFVLKKDIPLVIIDSLDKYWAAESKAALPLNGLRVPVEADTVAEAKKELAVDLAAQLRLLMMLSAAGTKLAPQLQENFLMLSEFLGQRS